MVVEQGRALKRGELHNKRKYTHNEKDYKGEIYRKKKDKGGGDNI